ncbi:hypothetical protein ES703_113987 [subsurface metagenome]
MKKIAKFLSLTAAVVALGAFLTSCESLWNDTGDGETGTLTVLLTDAPFPTDLVESAFVLIDSVVIHAKHTDEFITLSNDPTEYDLMELRDGATALLADLNIPTGEYNQIRLYVNNSEASVILSDGTTAPLTVASGEESGLKINVLPHLSIDAETPGEVLLDFDVSRSFTMLGEHRGQVGTAGFHFKPVVRAVNLAAAGRVKGTVSDKSNDQPIADAQVWIEKDTVLTTTFTDTSGAYTILGIPVDVYTVTATAAGYDTVSVADVSVEAKGVKTQNFQLTAQ